MTTVLILIAVVALAVGYALQREGRYVARRRAARRRDLALQRATAGFRDFGTAMSELGVAAGRAAAAMRGFADAYNRGGRS